MIKSNSSTSWKAVCMNSFTINMCRLHQVTSSLMQTSTLLEHKTFIPYSDLE